MFGVSDISLAGLILLVIILIIQYFYYAEHPKDDTSLEELDYNGDGYVSRAELRYYLNKTIAERKVKKLTKSEIPDQIWGGVIRGFLMGLVLANLEGGIALGIVLGVLKPVISSTQKLLA